MKKLSFKSAVALALSALAVLIVLITPFSTANAAVTRLKQYFGDASDTTFATGSVTSGSVLRILVNGVDKAFTFSDSATLSVAAAPASGAQVDIFETDEAISATAVQTSQLTFPATYNANGVVISSMLTTSGSVDFDSALTLADSTDVTFTLTGAAVNSPCVVGLPATVPVGHDYKCWVSSTNTVSLRSHNGTGGTVNNAAATFRVFVFKALNQLGL